MNDRTPSTDEVRSSYAEGQWAAYGGSAGTVEDFDRWLAAHDAEVCGRYVPSVAQVDAFVKAINDNGFVLDRGAVLSGLIAAAKISGSA